MIKLIFATTKGQGVIGLKDSNSLPWFLPEDLKIFKKFTLNNTILMGWNTWKSLNYTPLPKRRNIVLSNRSEDTDVFAGIYPKKELHNVLVYYSDSRIGPNDLYIIGGAKLFEEVITQYPEFIDEMIISWVNEKFIGEIQPFEREKYVYLPRQIFKELNSNFEIKNEVYTCNDFTTINYVRS